MKRRRGLVEPLAVIDTGSRATSGDSVRAAVTTSSMVPASPAMAFRTSASSRFSVTSTPLSPGHNQVAGC